MPKRILFLMSDTGGGHRAAAEAIRDALIDRFGAEAIEATLVDVFRLARFPLNYAPELYPWIVNHSKASWGIGYKLSNNRPGAALYSRLMYLSNRKRFQRMFIDHPADVVVSVHSVINRPTLRALYTLPKRPPHLTVVTDLVTTHHFWYDRRSDRCFVPTQAAFDRGLKARVPAAKMRITGLPVNPRFLKALQGKAAARAELGWHDPRPVVLMVAGGDGMGTLFETAKAINAMKLPLQLAIIAGRNQALKDKLEATQWHQPTHVYGFVRNMPTLMEGADLLVTKAGPATITEASIVGLPMILSDAIPGQEDGNVTFVVENGAGAFAPHPQEVADTVAQWLSEGPEKLAERGAAARRVALPNAVWEIAEEVWEYAQKPPLDTPPRRRLKRRRNKQGPGRASRV